MNRKQVAHPVASGATDSRPSRPAPIPSGITGIIKILLFTFLLPACSARPTEPLDGRTESETPDATVDPSLAEAAPTLYLELAEQSVRLARELIGELQKFAIKQRVLGEGGVSALDEDRFAFESRQVEARVELDRLMGRASEASRLFAAARAEYRRIHGTDPVPTGAAQLQCPTPTGAHLFVLLEEGGGEGECLWAVGSLVMDILMVTGSIAAVGFACFSTPPAGCGLAFSLLVGTVVGLPAAVYWVVNACTDGSGESDVLDACYTMEGVEPPEEANPEDVQAWESILQQVCSAGGGVS